MRIITIVIVVTTTVLLYACKKDKTPVPKIEPIEVDCKDTILFQEKILPLFQNECFSCHANGTLPLINDHATIASEAELILKTMRADGVSLMPQGGPPLPEEKIIEFNCWIKQGKNNN